MIDHQIGTSIVDDVFFHQINGTKKTFILWASNNLWILHMAFQVVVGSVFVILAAGLINPVREHKQGNKASKTKKKKSEE